jgi:hypothetical protein
VPKVNHIVLKHFISEYILNSEKKSGWQSFGDSISTWMGDNNSTEIKTQCDKLKLIILKLKQDDNAIIEILIDLGNLGRIAQTNRTRDRILDAVPLIGMVMGTSTSKLCQTAYAAISYILLTIAKYPDENAKLKQIISAKIVALEKELSTKEANFKKGNNLEQHNRECDQLRCDLASLGETKWVLISQRIKELYHNVDYPDRINTTPLAASITIVNEDGNNPDLPWILHLHYVNRYFAKDYISKTSLTNFIAEAFATHKKETGEDAEQKIEEEKKKYSEQSSASNTQSTSKIMSTTGRGAILRDPSPLDLNGDKPSLQTKPRSLSATVLPSSLQTGMDSDGTNLERDESNLITYTP